MSTHTQDGHTAEDLAVAPIDADRSLGDLFSRLGEDLTQLVSAQMELARAELKQEAKDAGLAAGLLGAGSALGYLTLTLLAFAAAWGLSEVVPEGVAFLIVGVVVGIVAAAVMLMGRRRLDEAKDVAPHTIETVKEDVQWTRQQMT